MKFPKWIDIKGAPYRIQVVQERRMQPGALGLCDVYTHNIYLSDKLDGEKPMQIFLHECFHAVWNECGLLQAHVSDDVVEAVCESFSSFLIDRFNLSFKKSRSNGGSVKKGSKKGGKKGGGKKGC